MLNGICSQVAARVGVQSSLHAFFSFGRREKEKERKKNDLLLWKKTLNNSWGPRLDDLHLIAVYMTLDSSFFLGVYWAKKKKKSWKKMEALTRVVYRNAKGTPNTIEHHLPFR